MRPEHALRRRAAAANRPRHPPARPLHRFAGGVHEPGGVPEGPGLGIELNEEAVKDLLVFMTPYSDFRNVYASDKFKALVDDADLKGLVFNEDLTSIL